MTVVGLHPEELIDKLLEGELTSVERERLRQHLDGCAVCRFEYAARFDFESEALTLASSAPPLTPLRAPRLVAPAPRRRRRRLLTWGLAAAALISASGALASVLKDKPVWRAVSLLVSRPPVPAEAGERSVRRAGPNVPVAVVAPAALEAAPSPTASSPVERVVREARPSKRSGAARSSVVEVPVRHSEATPKASVAVVDTEPAVKEPAPASELFAEANQARRAGDFGRAAGLYHLLQGQYPGSAEAELSRVTLALLLLDSGDARGALNGFERYLAGSSRGLEAEALVGRARALGRLGRRDLELAAWQEVQRKYPRSIYGRQASERLLALGQR